MGTNAGMATLVNPTGSGPWKPCETEDFRGVIVGSVIEVAMYSTSC